MNPAVVAWVERTRACQDLPPRIENPAILDEITGILTGAQVEGEADAVA